MPARFIHTADWQLGKPFASVANALDRALLQRERILAVGRIGAAARAHRAEFIVVAGDVFDSRTADSDTVAAACAAIGALALPVFAIPGNHDHGGPGSVWTQLFFQALCEKLAPNLRVLLAPEPVEFENALLLPCPLLRRHETADPTAWLRGLDFSESDPRPRVVLAHGSVQGFGAEDGGAANRLDLTRLDQGALDYLALGDWHGAKQISPRAWYPGTPEQDQFAKGATNEPGCVLAVTAARGALPQVEKIRTAQLGWHHAVFDFADDTGIDALAAQIDALLGTRAKQDLLRLELRGSLGIDAATHLDALLAQWQARLLRLDLANEVAIAPAPAELDTLTRRAEDPLIARVATQLVGQLGGEGANLARIALRELHAIAARG